MIGVKTSISKLLLNRFIDHTLLVTNENTSVSKHYQRDRGNNSHNIVYKNLITSVELVSTNALNTPILLRDIDCSIARVEWVGSTVWHCVGSGRRDTTRGATLSNGLCFGFHGFLIECTTKSRLNICISNNIYIKSHQSNLSINYIFHVEKIL